MIVIDTETELDHTVDTVSEMSGFFEGESGSKEGGLVKEPDEVLNGLITLILIGFLLKFLDDGVIGVDFHGLLGDHVCGHGRVTEGLGLHDTFHIGGPSVLTGNEDTGGFLESGSYDDLFNLGLT
jgi:hypothetical protein